MWRIRALAFLAAGRGVAGAILNPDRKVHIANRRRKIAANVGGKRLERGNIKGVQPGMGANCKFCERRQKTCQRLAATGWEKEIPRDVISKCERARDIERSLVLAGSWAMQIVSQSNFVQRPNQPF